MSEAYNFKIGDIVKFHGPTYAKIIATESRSRVGWAKIITASGLETRLPITALERVDDIREEIEYLRRNAVEYKTSQQSSLIDIHSLELAIAFLEKELKGN